MYAKYIYNYKSLKCVSRNLTSFDFEAHSNNICCHGVSFLYVGQSGPSRSAQTSGLALSHFIRQQRCISTRAGS